MHPNPLAAAAFAFDQANGVAAGREPSKRVDFPAVGSADP